MFYSGLDAQFSNWKLVFVVDIGYEEREECIKCITLNLAKGESQRNISFLIRRIDVASR